MLGGWWVRPTHLQPAAGSAVRVLGFFRLGHMVPPHLKSFGLPGPLRRFGSVLARGIEDVGVSHTSGLPLDVQSGGALGPSTLCTWVTDLYVRVDLAVRNHCADLP